ncbi:RNA-directed DNA polymerase, LTR Retrotransposon [Trachipleistophora hominis]|uniref:RNA-directed DNA polymerase, LTR Retrotransposon n=1 Tax=Trachipleistophora hominis TaxID=72359 RepID=L7JX80_TRAHO|nr:RNA-directed DNA polymerase, LTR Retrotransposon [Trachipleistophora hominis]
MKYVKGKENSFADMISRNHKVTELETEDEIVGIKLYTLKAEEKYIDLNEEKKNMIISKAHPAVEHGGINSTYNILAKRYKWKNLKREVIDFIKVCEPCTKFRDSLRDIQRIRINLKELFETIGLDIIGSLTKSENGYKFIITATDWMTKWAEARALKRKTAKEVAKFFIEEIMLRHGTPRRIVTDQGREFMEETLKKIFELLTRRKITTTPYNSKCNCAVERFNGTLMNIFLKLSYPNIHQWDEF